MAQRFGIVRISDPLKANQGHGIASQLDRLQSWGHDHATIPWAKAVLSPGHPPGFCVDAGVSAYTVDFRDRPSVRRMIGRLQPGDQIVVTRIDRVWRKMRDFCNCVSWLAERKVDLVVLDPPIDFSKSTGRLLAHLLVAFAEFESAIKSERVREANAAAKARRAADKKQPAKQTKKTKKPVRLSWVDGDYCPVPPEVRRISPGGRVYIYLRCSHLDSAKSGLGLEAQLQMALRHVDMLVERNPLLSFGGVYCDEVVSAWKIPFLKRPKGGELSAALQAGDTVVFPRLDRGFRDTKDLLNTVPAWLERGVNVAIVDVDLDMTSWTGPIVMEVLTLAAKIEAAITSARYRDMCNYLRAHGMGCLGVRIQQFLRKIKIRRNGKRVKRYVWDRAKLARFRYVDYVARNRRRFGFNLHQALQHCENLFAKRQGRKPININGESPSRHPGRKPAKWSKLIYPEWNKYLYETTVPKKPLEVWRASRNGRIAQMEATAKVELKALPASSSASLAAPAEPPGPTGGEPR